MLAKAILRQKYINKATAENLMKLLNNRERKELLFYLKKEMNANTVGVISASSIPTEYLKKIKSIYEGKSVVVSVDETLGGGVIIKDGDTYINISLKNFMYRALESIKQTL